MIFRWLRNRRRRLILQESFPRVWEQILTENVLHYSRLDPSQQLQLQRLTQVFVAEKNWEGLEGLEMTDEIRVTIAALACLLLIGRPEELDFDHVLSILVYPDIFVAREQQPNEAGIVSERREARSGEAWYRGPVILSWEDALADARQEDHGRNVVIHEFAHQLDMAHGGLIDGTPTLRQQQVYKRWAEVMSREYEELCRRCRRRQPGVIDCYGCKDAAEFFAVVTESFFERPYALRQQHPDLYELLGGFFGLEPVEWTGEFG